MVMQRRWQDPGELNRSIMAVELAKNPDLKQYIPRTNNGKPRKLDTKVLPNGIERGSKQAELWSKVLRNYQKVINFFRKLEDQWMAALLIYKNLAMLNRIVPFPKTAQTESDAFNAYAPMLDSKARRAVRVALNTLGWSPDRIKISKVEVLPECPLLVPGVPCLRIALSHPKRKGDQIPSGANRKISQKSMEELGFNGQEAYYLGSDGPLDVYLVSRPRQWVLHLLSALPTTLKDMAAKVKNRVRETVKEELSRR